MEKLFNKFNSIYLCIVAIFLLISCFFPNNFNLFKILILAVLTLVSVIMIYLYKIPIKRSYVCVLFCFVLYSFFSLCLTYVNGFNIDFKLIEIWIIRPILLLIITVPISLKDNKDFLYKSVIFVSKLLVLYDILFMLNVLIFNTDFFLFSNIFSQSGPIILDSSFVTIRMENFTSLMFLLPLLNWELVSKIFDRNASFFDIIVFISGNLVTLFSGRRAFQIIVILTLIVTILVSFSGQMSEVKKYTKENFKKLIAIILLIISIYILNVFGVRDFIRTVIRTILDAFDATSHSGVIRANQLVHLTNEFLINPFFGSGLGAYVLNFVRHDVYKWSYEFFYNALLMQIGAFGMISLSILTTKILYNVSRFSLNMSKPVLIGAISFFIAASSNPMFTSPWVWFILIGLSHESTF